MLDGVVYGECSCDDCCPAPRVVSHITWNSTADTAAVDDNWRVVLTPHREWRIVELEDDPAAETDY